MKPNPHWLLRARAAYQRLHDQAAQGGTDSADSGPEVEDGR